MAILNAGRDTSWANLGDWREARDYPGAAEALAVRLGRAAGLGPGMHVVDAGCGAGDQLTVWVERFGVERVTAVERDPDLATRAAERARRSGGGDRIVVRTGDAVDALQVGTDLRGGAADCVLSLDAAYFFRSRHAFFAGARSVLGSGGTLALADLTLGRGPGSALARLLAPLCGVPPGALLTRDRWVDALTTASFRDVEIEDCTDDVLRGFERWVGGPGGPVRHLPGTAEARGLALLGRTAGWMARSRALGYAIVTATAA